MHGTVDILNETYTVTERLRLWSHSGCVDEIPDDILAAFARSTEHGTDALEADDFIVVIDGEVVETGEFAPFNIDIHE